MVRQPFSFASLVAFAFTALGVACTFGADDYTLRDLEQGVGGTSSSGGTGEGGDASTGGDDSSGGGSVSTGGQVTSGGAPNAGGTATGGLATGGAVGTGGETAACPHGVAGAASVPEVSWQEFDGIDGWQSGGDATSGTTVTTAQGVTKTPHIYSVNWIGGNEGMCADASAFTGIQFDVSSTATDLTFRVAISATDENWGHCSGEAGLCFDYHAKAVATNGTAIKVPFAELAQQGWGAPATFDTSQITGYLWETSDMSCTITVSNVKFY